MRNFHRVLKNAILDRLIAVVCHLISRESDAVPRAGAVRTNTLISQLVSL